MARSKVTKSDTINIKTQALQSRLGALRFTNSDWGVVAFLIPRDIIDATFADKELQYNSIYFLVGSGGAKEKVYVGQAKKRNGGGSVLIRLREHKKSYTEPYRDIWNYAIVVTGKDDDWGATELNALEHILCNMVPAENNLNGNNPNAGGEIDYDIYSDKLRQIISYLAVIGVSVFLEKAKDDIEKIQVTNDDSNLVEDLQDGLSRIPEYITPVKVINQMLDMLPAEVWNPSTTFLDPACKGGEFLKAIYDRLMKTESLIALYPNEMARTGHILNNQVFGIALSEQSLSRANNTLFNLSHNIIRINNFLEILKVKGDNKVLKEGTLYTVPEYIAKEFNRKDMKFDVVISNPPYQEVTGGRNAKPLYNLFVTSLYDMVRHYICFVTPSRWVNGGIGLDSFREFMLTNKSLQYINDNRSSDSVFRGVIISGGVMFFLINKDYSGKCTIDYTNEFGEQSRRVRYLSDDGVYIRDNIAVGIIGKVKSKDRLEKLMSSLNPFGIDADVRGGQESSVCKHKLLSSGGVGYVADRDILKGHECISYYKTVVAKALSSKPGKVLGTVAVLEPGDVCTFSYFIAGLFKDMEQALNLSIYLQTKFTRFLVFITTASINTSKKNYALVPLQNFSSQSDIDWTQSISDIDKQLYKKYNLSEAEIAYIEKTIKPME